MRLSIFTAALLELAARTRRDADPDVAIEWSLAFTRAIAEAAAAMYALQHEVLTAQRISVQGVGREA